MAGPARLPILPENSLVIDLSACSLECWCSPESPLLSQGAAISECSRAGIPSWREYQAVSAATLSTVFQLRAVPSVSSFLSINEFVNRERPIPSG